MAKRKKSRKVCGKVKVRGKTFTVCKVKRSRAKKGRR